MQTTWQDAIQLLIESEAEIQRLQALWKIHQIQILIEPKTKSQTSKSRRKCKMIQALIEWGPKS